MEAGRPTAAPAPRRRAEWPEPAAQSRRKDAPRDAWRRRGSRIGFGAQRFHPWFTAFDGQNCARRCRAAARGRGKGKELEGTPSSEMADRGGDAPQPRRRPSSHVLAEQSGALARFTIQRRKGRKGRRRKDEGGRTKCRPATQRTTLLLPPSSFSLAHWQPEVGLNHRERCQRPPCSHYIIRLKKCAPPDRFERPPTGFKGRRAALHQRGGDGVPGWTCTSNLRLRKAARF